MVSIRSKDEKVEVQGFYVRDMEMVELENLIEEVSSSLSLEV